MCRRLAVQTLFVVFVFALTLPAMAIISVATNGITGGGISTVAEASDGIANHLVISEVSGDNDDPFDFVELYNPTSSQISLDGWSIQYKSATGDFGSIAKKNLTGGIKPEGFYLIAKSGVTPTPDCTWAQNLSQSNGNVFLVNNTGKLTGADDSNIVDKVAYGNGDSPETSPAPSPGADKSVERKTDEMGIDHSYGNGWDTNNNSEDFLVSDPNPQNSISNPISPMPELSPALLFSIGFAGIGLFAIYRKRKAQKCGT